MRYLLLFFLSSLFLITSCSNSSKDIEFKAESFQISISNEGILSKFIDTNSKHNYIVDNSHIPIMSVRMQKQMLVPESAVYDDQNKVLKLTYQNNIKAQIKIIIKKTHLTFELIKITPFEKINLIAWGPYPLTIKKIIGETIGVVQGETFAIGIQSLNIKTLGGYPWTENDCMPQLDIFEQSDFSDLNEKGKRGVLYRVEAAKPEVFGSTIQAYSRTRSKERVIKNWNHEKYTAPVYNDGGVLGSKIALFGCPVKETLTTIGEIEIAEGLPHPMIDGKWGKITPTASAAYIILDFSEDDIQDAIDVTKSAGLRYLYHSGPFETWGHFKLNNQFPNGWKGLKKCIDQAQTHDIMVGVHTLSNFITTNDPYVTPVPDKRLALVGISSVTEDIALNQKEIPVKSPDFFNQYKNNSLRTVIIDDELIRYGSVSEQAPWKLVDCQRGAFGTKPSIHKNNSKIGKLADHGYKVFLTNAELTIEMSKNLSDLFNKTGLRQISFDGLEGNRSTGMGNYGEILFTQTWYNNLDENIRKHYIADASRTSHYFWHMYTRMNWGEPWYAGFRESQTDYRLKNQKYFSRNLMPGMLGWFKMTPETSIEDIEWMLARSAAFDAGYAYVTNYETLKKNAHSKAILNLLGVWEEARMSGIFSAEQKKRMEDLKNEFTLKKTEPGEWELNQIYSFKFKHENKVRQPGEPLHSTFTFNNYTTKQPMNFILTSKTGNLSRIKVEIDNYKEIPLSVNLKAGETIKYTGGNQAVIYTSNWEIIKKVKIDASLLTVAKGEHTINFDCKFSGSKESEAKLEIRFRGEVENLTGK